MKKRLSAVILCLLLILSGCSKKKPENEGYTNPETQGETVDLGGDSATFGEALDEIGAYDGYFEEDVVDVNVICVSGSKNCYTLEGNVLKFSAISEESVYSISGKLKGNIVIDVSDDYKFELELCGFSLVSDSECPVTVQSGDEVSIQAKKDTVNYIYDMREAVDSTDENAHSGAVHSEVDLEIGGKGALKVVSENNNGIHSKDDLEVKNLTLFTACTDNALKGNDSVEITEGALTLIATAGDGIKTSNSDVSEKGNQRGTISIAGGTHTIYAACDGIDAAYNVTIDDETTSLTVYTDKYSNYSEEVTAVSEEIYYIRYTNQNYNYSVKYYNSDTDFLWVNAEYHSSVQGSRSTYYYYSFPKKTEYAKLKLFVYSSGMEQGQEEVYNIASDYITPNASYDTIAVSGAGYNWTNYTLATQSGGFGGSTGGRPSKPGGSGGPGGMGGGMGGPGGMGDGNSDKSDHSTKGIKAANEIMINAGSISIKAYDDAIHANNDTALENGASPLGNVTVNGGNLTLYTNDDGLHADGTLSITSGTISVTNSYEGIEGTAVSISGGYVSVKANDDGINGTTTSGEAITISGGTLYIHCGGDGIDSNSRSSYKGIVFSGGNTVVISTSGGNSAIDSEQGYSYTGGAVVAIMPRGGMSNEATHCQNFSSVGSSTSLSLGNGEYLTAKIGGSTATIRIPDAMSAYVITLGDSSPSLDTSTSVTVTLDSNGVCWS